MTLELLCEKIRMPLEMTADLFAAPALPDADVCIAGLCDPLRYAETARRLEETVGDDPRGIKTLAVMLRAACKGYKEYLHRGMPDIVYFDTMKCFSRFVDEHFTSYGTYGFDRAYWVGRQLSLLLFRLGELEYEFAELNGTSAISIHIPSDADLSPQKIEGSIWEAMAFFKEFFPNDIRTTWFCNSWLLSPALPQLLPPTSRILKFQQRFEIVSFDKDAQDYKQWVFKNKDLTPEQFPENTSLQRNLKTFVLNGGKPGCALGILRKDDISVIE